MLNLNFLPKDYNFDISSSLILAILYYFLRKRKYDFSRISTPIMLRGRRTYSVFEEIDFIVLLISVLKNYSRILSINEGSIDNNINKTYAYDINCCE